jgi:hypothetical protein
MYFFLYSLSSQSNFAHMQLLPEAVDTTVLGEVPSLHATTLYYNTCLGSSDPWSAMICAYQFSNCAGLEGRGIKLWAFDEAVITSE